MENDAIEVLVEPTPDEYRRVLRERGAETIKNLRIALGVVLAAMSLWTLNFLLVSDLDGTILRTFVWVLAVLFALVVLGYASLLFGIRSQVKKFVGTGEPITYWVSRQGLKSATTMTTVDSSWRRFSEVKETTADFLFILENGDFIPIPKHFSPEASAVIRVRELITAHARVDLRG